MLVVPIGKSVMRQVHFNRIVIIESLAEGKTGRRLYEDLKTLRDSLDHIVEVEFKPVENKGEILSYLKEMQQVMKKEGVRPVIHIECHGSAEKDGLIMSSGEFLSWSELKQPMTSINQLSHFNLMLCFAACHGAYFCHQLTPLERAPCFLTIGPVDQISTRSLLADFKGFYEAVLAGKPASASIEILNGPLLTHEVKYAFITAEYAFELAWGHFKKSYASNDYALKKHAADILNMLKNDQPPRVFKRMTKNEIEKKLRGLLPNYLQNWLINYFMTDIFPENWGRFDLDRFRNE